MRVHFTVLIYGDGPNSHARTETTIRSLLGQTYADWTLAESKDFDGVGSAHLVHEPRVPSSLDSSHVVLLPRGASLHPTALETVAEASSIEGARLVTWDLRERDGDDVRELLGFGWSPETLLSVDYTRGCFAISIDDYRAAVESLGQEAVTSWSLLLRLPVDLSPTRHIPVTLAEIPPSAPADEDAATETINAGLRFRGVPASSMVANGVRRLRWETRSWPTVSIVIPTRHNEALMGSLFTSLALTSPHGPRFDVIVIDNGERTPDAEEFYRQDWAFSVSVTWWNEVPFHYGRVNNTGVALSQAEYVLLLNDDTDVIDAGWLAEMVGLAMLPGVGAVGTSLLTANGRLQHAGVWLGLGGYAGHYFAGLEPGTATIFGSTSWYRNLLAVTAACLCIRKDTFESIGGFDEEMILAGSDVTLGLDCVAKGLRNICSPVPGLHHYESLTRSSATLNDQIVSLIRYQPWHDGGDPYGNPRLSLRSSVPVLRPADEVDPVVASRIRAGVVL